MLEDLELLYSPLDDIFDSVVRALDDHSDLTGHYSFTPYFSSIIDKIAFPDFEPTIKYPVANCYIENNGVCVIEIAVTGFSKENIEIMREGNVIIVKGKGNTDKDDDLFESNRRYLFRRLAKRNFRVSYKLSDKLNFDKIKTFLENGVLKISIPLKENEKPIVEKIEIK